MSDSKMYVLIFRAAKRTLKCKNIVVEYLLGQDSSCCSFSLLFLQEATVSEGEASKKFTDQIRKLFPFPRIVSVMTAIDKHIFLHRMSMQIAKEHNLPNLINALHEFLTVINFWVENFGRIFPFSI